MTVTIFNLVTPEVRPLADRGAPNRPFEFTQTSHFSPFLFYFLAFFDFPPVSKLKKIYKSIFLEKYLKINKKEGKKSDETNCSETVCLIMKQAKRRFFPLTLSRGR